MKGRPKGIRISAVVSNTTKRMLDRNVQERGLDRDGLVEDALRQYLQALQELPEDAVIPSTLKLTRKSFEDVVREVESPGDPPPALTKLMRGR